jgi:hypothetical protein
METTSECPVCKRPSLKFSRHCARHNKAMTRLGDPEGRAVEYRTEVKPHFHRWCADGLQRLRQHPATAAGIELANMLLQYTAPPNSIQHRQDTGIEAVFTELRNHGVTAEDLLCRVAELQAFLKRHPGRAKNTRATRFVFARGIIHLIRRNGTGERTGALVMNGLGEMVLEYLGAWSIRFVDKLDRDSSHTGELMRQAANYD